MNLNEIDEPSLPGLPMGLRWKVDKKFGWHWVCLQEQNKRGKWKEIKIEKAAVFSWAESYKPSSEELPKAILEAATSLLDQYKEKDKLKTVSENWVGVYEQRKALPQSVRR